MAFRLLFQIQSIDIIVLLKYKQQWRLSLFIILSLQYVLLFIFRNIFFKEFEKQLPFF